MAYTRELNTNFNFANIDIYNVLNDGVLSFYEARPQEGYVVYDITANDVEYQIDDTTGESVSVSVIYYKTLVSIPKTYNFNNFPYVAVLRSTVDENYIFGDGDNNNHEII